MNDDLRGNVRLGILGDGLVNNLVFGLLAFHRFVTHLGKAQLIHQFFHPIQFHAHHVRHGFHHHIRPGADIDVHRLSHRHLSAGNWVCPDDNAFFINIAGFFLCQRRKALIFQQIIGILSAGTHQVIHRLGFRFRAHAYGDPQIRTTLNLFSAFRLLANDLSCRVGVIVFLRQGTDVEICVLFRKARSVGLPFQIGHFHNILFLVQQCSVKQRYQEYHNGNYGNGAADHNSCGSHPAALFLFLPFLGFAPLMCPTDALVFYIDNHAGGSFGSGLTALVQADAVGGSPGAGFGLHLFLRRGSGLCV